MNFYIPLRFLSLISISVINFFHFLHGGFRLSPPEIVKASWNARNFLAEDLNQDGLNDLIFFNPEKSRIEILYRTADGNVPDRILPVKQNRWDPFLEDAPYKKEYIFLPEPITVMTIGDLNEDGLLDIVCGSPVYGVSVYFRLKNSAWSDGMEVEAFKLRPDSISLKIRDGLEGDTPKLFLFTEKGLEVIEFENGKAVYPSIVYREEAKLAYGLHFYDVNSDGIEDWIYSVPSSKRSIRLRLGTKNGFGPERSFDIPIASFNPIPNFENNGKFVGINKISKQVSVFSFEVGKKESPASPFQRLDFDLFSEGEKQTSWAFTDFNLDGHKDIVAATSSLGELCFLPAISNKEFGSIKKSPSLKGVTSLNSFKLGSNKKPGVLILSQMEEIIGISKFTSNGRFSFPQPIPVGLDPILSNCTDLNSDQIDEALIILEDRSDFILQIWSLKNGEKFHLTQEIELEEWKREPSGIFPCYLNDDDAVDIVLLSSRETAYLFLNDGNGTLQEVGEDSVLRKSFLREKNLSEVGSGDVDGDGIPDLLISAEGMVRAIKWKDDDLNVINQFNSTDPKAELRCPKYFDLDGDGKNELIYFSGDYWEGLQMNAEGEYQKLYKIEDCSVVPSATSFLDSKNNKSLLSMGTSSLQVIVRSDDLSEPGVLINSEYLTDLPKVYHTGVDWGDFNHDGKMDLVCMDGRRQTLEFLSTDKEGKWTSTLHFEVFEKDLHYRGKKGGAFEPRDGIVEDLNGDGLDDLVLLVHDRFLCYYQEKDSLK